jgi:uncharacterized protein
MIFIDTSAFLAVIVKNDVNHAQARITWEKLLLSRSPLFCSNYVLIETISILQNRVGLQAVRSFQEDVVPLLTVEWVDAPIHRIGMESLMAANRRNLSLVDCTSFTLMRNRGIRKVFAFDGHFTEYGFLLEDP